MGHDVPLQAIAIVYYRRTCTGVYLGFLHNFKCCYIPTIRVLQKGPTTIVKDHRYYEYLDKVGYNSKRGFTKEHQMTHGCYVGASYDYEGVL